MTVRVDLTSIAEWNLSSKTRPVRVKHITAILSDMKVSPSMLVRTLEGDQTVRPDAFVSIGHAGEMWQQEKKNLFKKYDITECDADGWWTAVPKPGNVVDSVRIGNSQGTSKEPFEVKGKWGTLADDGSYYQTGKPGDFVLRSREDPEDVWIVEENIYYSTYETACFHCMKPVRDYYMVKNHLWETATEPSERHLQLHWDCLEARLAEDGITLASSDLTGAPVNIRFREKRGWPETHADDLD